MTSINCSLGAVFGFEFSEYTVDEDTGEIIVSILLLEMELAVPVSLQIIPSDISACENQSTELVTLILDLSPGPQC